ncbi:MAG: ATP-binding protein [Candidatus Omnitrophica bacterium]|nr:ATP-binding protein [Candidatus Omnitrophota bacterium]
MRIGQKISLGYWVVILLVGLLSTLGIYISQRALRETIGTTTVLLAQEMVDKIDRNIYRRIETLQQFLNDRTVRDVILSANETYERIENINQYIKEKDEEWLAQPSDAVTPFMQSFINNSLAERLKDMVAFYENEDGYKVLPEIFVTNKYGANIAQNHKTTDYYQADEEWWQKARANGIYVGNVSLDESSGVYSTDIGIRINDKNGNFIGAAKVVLNIEEVITILDERKYNKEAPKSMEFKLIDRNGRVIYTTENIPRLARLSPAVTRQLFQRQTSNYGYFIEQCEAPKGGQELFAYVRSTGYKDYKGLGWILLIEHETKEIFSPVSRLRNLLIIILIGGTLVNIVIGLYISRAISEPVKKLTIAAKEIGEGKLDTRIAATSRDELGFLAASFNEMAENLKKSTTSIENLNKEVSERKKAEEYLRNTYEELKKIQNHLIQAEKLHAMGLLAGGLAHEVKNPLAVIMQGTDYLLKMVPPEDSETIKTLNVIKRNVMRADNIIKDLLDFSKTTSLNLYPDDINNILDNSWELIKPQLKASNVKIIKQLKKDLPKVMVDKAKIEQVFINVLLNSIQAMPKAGELYVRTYDKNFEPPHLAIPPENIFFKQGEKVVVVEIEDTGMGISEENLKNIFDPFFTTKGPREGAGLGLSVSKSILSMHKATIEIESKLGKGTRTIITLKTNIETNV